jgi:UvrD-like helicase C-terminal domain/AAA domain
MARHDVAVESLTQKVNSQGIRAVNSNDGALPDVLILDPVIGFVAIFVLMNDEFLEEEKLRDYLQTRLRNLRLELSGLMNPYVKPQSKVLRIDASFEASYINFSTDFLEGIDAPVLDAQLLDLVHEKFNPRFAFIKKRRLSIDDPNRENREKIRIVLRDEQREVVDAPAAEILWITGPAGSGKSLILMARAIKMSKLFPEYQISFITFNQSLKRYFQDELSAYSNILVESFGEFTARRGNRFHFYFGKGKEKKSVSFDQTELDYKKARSTGILRDIDAIFIDEVQDFYPAWLRYCVESQRRDRGGVTMAGDESQAIYRENDTLAVAEEYELVRYELPVAYRSTKEILTVVEHLSGIKHALERSPSGPLPDLIYVDKTGKADAMNEAVIRDLIGLLKHDGVRERDIAILVTSNYMRYKLRSVLEERLKDEFRYDVQVASIEKGAADQLNLEEDSIKLTTIHNAKGLEFSVVFLLGLDELSENEEDLPMIRKGERLVLVGPTRAKDRLFIYYCKMNSYLERLNEHPESVTFRVYPDDYTERVG